MESFSGTSLSLCLTTRTEDQDIAPFVFFPVTFSYCRELCATVNESYKKSFTIQL